MTGHPKPRRSSARPKLLPSRRRPQLFLLLMVLVAGLVLLTGGGLLVAGCGSDAAKTSTTVAAAAEGTFPATVTDDNGKTVTVAAEPQRIVSTAPASTETLFALGVGDRVVGVTSLCDYPAEVAAIAKIGDFTANTEAVMALSPDLVIGYSGNEEALAPVEAAGAAVVVLNPATVEGIYDNITSVGAVTGATGRAAEVVEALKAQIAQIADAAVATGESPKVFYALDNTLWTAGTGSFVDELLKIVNATNVGSMPGTDSAAAQAYYQFAPEQLIAADPDVILLPNTAYQSIDEFVSDPRFAELKAVKQDRVYLIDDVIVTRPGPRVGEGLKALLEAVHPGAL